MVDEASGRQDGTCSYLTSDSFLKMLPISETTTDESKSSNENDGDKVQVISATCSGIIVKTGQADSCDQKYQYSKILGRI